MKNHLSNKSRFKQNTKIAITATMLTVPILSLPATGFAQEKKLRESPTMSQSSAENISLDLKYSDIFVKIKETYSIAGLDNGHTIYKNNKGEYFYLDPNTGDMKFISADYFAKFKVRSSAEGSLHKNMKFGDAKKFSQVSLLGVDAQGNVVQQNGKGEKFYLDPITGDQVFVK